MTDRLTDNLTEDNNRDSISDNPSSNGIRRVLPSTIRQLSSGAGASGAAHAERCYCTRLNLSA